MPNFEIQPLRNACIAVLAVLSGSGMASGHFVKLSTHVSIDNFVMTVTDLLYPHVHDQSIHLDWQKWTFIGLTVCLCTLEC